MEKVVIVDDNVLTVQALTQTLPWAELGCELCGSAADGESGLELIEREQPSLVISDIKMPVMSGLEMIHRAKSERLKVIFITGYQEFEFAQRAIKLGAVDFLLKPVDNEELIKAIKKAFSDKSISIKQNEALSVKELILKKPVSFLVKSILEYLCEHFCEELSLQALADIFYVHPAYLSAIIKKETGENFTSIIVQMRIEKAKELLQNAHLPIKDVCFECGFNDYAYFYQIFKKHTGASPSEYKAQL